MRSLGGSWRAQHGLVQLGENGDTASRACVVDLLRVHPEREHFVYKKILLAYDGSIEGRRALREGARIAQLCGAVVLLLAVVDTSGGRGTLDGGFVLPISEQIEVYKNILAEGVERLNDIVFAPTA